MSETVTWVTQQLAAAGFTALPSLRTGEYFETTGFAVEASSTPDAARVTVTARFTGQHKYDQWGEAQAFANKLMDVLERLGTGFEEIEGREPNCAFDAYPPKRPAGSEEKTPVRDEAPALRLVTDDTCTATLQGWPIEVVDECVREAGHYNEADPESWHQAEPESGGSRRRWSDSASGATPHRAGPVRPDEEPTP